MYVTWCLQVYFFLSPYEPGGGPGWILSRASGLEHAVAESCIGSRVQREVTPRVAGPPLDLNEGDFGETRHLVQRTGPTESSLGWKEVRVTRLLVIQLAPWLEWIREF